MHPMIHDIANTVQFVMPWNRDQGVIAYRNYQYLSYLIAGHSSQIRKEVRRGNKCYVNVPIKRPLISDRPEDLPHIFEI
jgi:hypothetical protein